jgi:hypothetical protein
MLISKDSENLNRTVVKVIQNFTDGLNCFTKTCSFKEKGKDKTEKEKETKAFLLHLSPLEKIILPLIPPNAAVEWTPTEPPYGGGGGNRAWDRKLHRNFWDRDRRSTRTACLTDFFCPQSERSMPGAP